MHQARADAVSNASASHPSFLPQGAPFHIAFGRPDDDDTIVRVGPIFGTWRYCCPGRSRRLVLIIMMRMQGIKSLRLERSGAAAQPNLR